MTLPAARPTRARSSGKLPRTAALSSSNLPPTLGIRQFATIAIIGSLRHPRATEIVKAVLTFPLLARSHRHCRKSRFVAGVFGEDAGAETELPRHRSKARQTPNIAGEPQALPFS